MLRCFFNTKKGGINVISVADILKLLGCVIYFTCVILFFVKLFADNRAKRRRADKILDELNSQNQYHYEKPQKNKLYVNRPRHVVKRSYFYVNFVPVLDA